MSKITRDCLYDVKAANTVLGLLMRDLSLLYDNKLVVEDFDVQLHKDIFSLLHKLSEEGYSKTNPEQFEMEMLRYEQMNERFHKENGTFFVQNCYEQTETYNIEESFNVEFLRIKRFSILRELERQGFDTTSIYNPGMIEGEPEERLHAMDLETITESFVKKLITINDDFLSKSQTTSILAGEGLSDLIASFQNGPDVGPSMGGHILSSSVRGARQGKLYLYSAATGNGKTRFLINNAVMLCLPYFDVELNKWIVRDEYPKGLFVTTEMEHSEIQVLILACVTGINQEKLEHSQLTDEEIERLDHARQIIEQYQTLFIEYMPDPNGEEIKLKFQKHIKQNDVQYIFYDYIFTSPSLISQFKGANIQENVALMMLSNTLKEIASSNGVFILSGTQLNESGLKADVGPRDQSMIRGSKAIADKADVGLIGARLKEEEAQKISKIWEQIQKTNIKYANMKINMVVDIYKNRSGSINGCKIFRYFDFGTCRSTDLFITDGQYESVQNTLMLEEEVKELDFAEVLEYAPKHEVIDAEIEVVSAEEVIDE